ncbi:DHA1 family bicyclomycin/chloramphenicol resistance-like MFS transporter [Nocardioides aromaticivorans]|uniref:DHA1 family bicyclomycin/chloramphenicol resistance-like MFS transporter n=2 Tax=Nocardioides aromaticivorans TaxID=200618 RepID=A0A7Z0CLZ7_9ACTN|nr:multidrug effflux MFS transporter [Nocardioides aromaticivorans]NYI43305.1 DHA1 family bicyclomycin/chloramphenicol resistance-like MFS transporter [Nocardioides aromaticivorans]
MTTTPDERLGWRLTVLVPVVLGCLSMIGPFSIDTPFPAFAQMERELPATAGQLQLVVTVYLAAFAAMSVLHGPISDAVGRRPVMVVGLTVYAAASIACAFAPDLGWLLVGRALQGLSAGGATIVSRTVIRDLFSGATAQRLMSRVALVFGVAPAIGPIIGGLVLQLGDWPLVFVFQAGLGVVLVLAVVLLLPETHPRERRTALRVGSVVGGLLQVAREPAFHRLAWATALLFGAQFLYIGGAAIFVVDVLGEGELDFWKLFVPMIGAMMLGSWLCGRAAGRISARRLTSIGCTTSFVGGVIGILVAASPLAADLPWAVVGVSLVALGNGITYPTIQLLLLDLFPGRLGAVVSMSAFLALVLNAITAVAVTPHLGTSALGFATAAFIGVAGGQLCWAWHCAVENRDCAVAGVGEREPVELL